VPKPSTAPWITRYNLRSHRCPASTLGEVCRAFGLNALDGRERILEGFLRMIGR
jgi:hypothetical protein